MDFRRNIALLNRSRVQSAIGEVEKSISENARGAPIDYYTQLSLGLSFYRAKQFDKSIKAFEDATKMGEESLNPEIMVILSQLNFKIGNKDKAKQLIATWY